MGVIKTAITGAVTKLGKISNFSVGTSAVSPDPSDSSGVLPTFSTSFAGGEDGEYAVGETLTLESPSIGKYEGEIVSASLPSKSNVLNLDTNTLLEQLNTDVRLYPLVGSMGTSESVNNPTAGLEYYTQQCGLFYDAVPGLVHSYASRFRHDGVWGRGVTRIIDSRNVVTSMDYLSMAYVNMNGRWIYPFSVNMNNYLTYPDSQPIMVLVPEQSTEQLVIGGWVRALSAQVGYVTWKFADSSLIPVQVRLKFDSASGVMVYHSTNGTTWSALNFAGVPLPVGQSIHYTVAMHEVSGTQTAFTLRLFAEDGSSLSDTTYTVVSNVRGSLRLIQRHIVGEGSIPFVGQGLYSYGEYLTTMAHIPTEPPATQKELTTGYRLGAFPIGWSGNAWEHIKRWCSIYHLDIGYENGKMVVGPKKRDAIVVQSSVQADKNIQSREQARAIEIVNYQHKPTVYVDTVMWSADTVYQIGVAEVQEFLVQTENSIATLAQPVAVGGISPYPYTVGTGQYVVTGSDGYIVSPAFWRDQGGSITAETTDNEGEIKIIIKGPDFQSSRAPYRISEGAADRPALYISGTGVLMTPKTLRVGTGNTKATKDVGVTFDSTFIGSNKLAYEVASQVAKGFAVPDYTLSLQDNNGYAKPSSFGDSPAGEVISQKGNNFRVLTANQNPSGVTATAEQSNRIGDYSDSFPSGATIGDSNAYFEGKTIRNFNVAPLKEASRERIN